MDLLAILNRGANHTQSGAVSAGCQRSGIAVCEHASGVRHEDSPMWSHGFIGINIFHQHLLGFFHQADLDGMDALLCHRLKLLLHATDRPEKIDRRRARLADGPADLAKFIAQSCYVWRGGLLYSK